MYNKVVTKDCPSCELMFIDDINNFRCTWGKSKKGKRLLDAKGKSRNCNLKGKNNAVYKTRTKRAY